MTQDEAHYDTGAIYNVLDDIEHLSQEYGKNCEVEAEKHRKKACYGFFGTLAAALIGFLYTIIHLFSAGYYSGAKEVYGKFDNIIEDSDKIEDEWRDFCNSKKNN